ncbi:hypothetical protein ACMD2_02503 [Ananas comosus]|uniref:Uncharacterized protein n=1 Tax=Ananas comosus TaxID=4615 RepID=A0A199V977_ANACO|nr:hypothetical protein ACMD2_02503 [Ananas comosus]
MAHMLAYSLNPAGQHNSGKEGLGDTRPKLASQRGPACSRPVRSRHGRHLTGSSFNLALSLPLSLPSPPPTPAAREYRTRVSVLIMQFPGTSSDHAASDIALNTYLNKGDAPNLYHSLLSGKMRLPRLQLKRQDQSECFDAV